MTRTARMAVAIAAAALAVGGWWVAPDDWEPGPGRVEVRVGGTTTIDDPVTIGDDEELSSEGPWDGGTVRVTFPEGIATDEPTTARLAFLRPNGLTRPPELSEVVVELVLPDGRHEAVPITSLDSTTDELVALRRPSTRAPVVLGLLGIVVVLWVSAAIPLWTTSLLVPVVLVFGEVGTATEMLAPFFHPIIALFFAGFLMAEAMQRAGLDQRIARTIVLRAPRSPAGLFGTLVACSAGLSMWMSNTAAVTLLIPIVLAVTAPLESPGYRRAAVLGIAYAATVGGVGSAIGTPANLLAIEFLDTFTGREITFVEWFAFGLPLLVLLLPVIGVYVWRREGVVVDAAVLDAARRNMADEAARAAPLGRDEWQVVGVFVLVAGTWLTAGWHGLDTGVVALAGAVVLSALGRLEAEDLGAISWPSLLTFGGGLTMGLALTSTGVSDWIATRLGGLSGLPSPVAVAVVALVALVMTTVASNTATAATMIPLAIPLAAVLGVDPTHLVVVIAIASSIDFALVIGTPPTMLAYSTGLFTPQEILRTGSALDVVGLALLVTTTTWAWGLLGLV